MVGDTINIDGIEYSKANLLGSHALVQRCLTLQSVMGACSIGLLIYRNKLYLISAVKPSVSEINNAENIINFELESAPESKPIYMG